MIRKALLLLGTLSLLLLFGAITMWFLPNEPTTRNNPNVTAPSLRPADADASREVTIYDRDENGMQKSVYHVTSWKKLDDGSIYLNEPRAVIYHEDGRRTYARADEGKLYTEMSSETFNVRNGRMWGNVEIFHDQSRDMQRQHPKDRPAAQVAKETIHVTTDEISFDRDMLEVICSGVTDIRSRQVDLFGAEGVVIQWNESPRELRELRMKKAKVLAVKELPESANVMQLPKSKDETAAKSAKTPAKKPVKKLAKKPAIPGESTAVARNIYTATFMKDVHVVAGESSLAGAQELALRFEWDQSWRADEKKNAAKPEDSDAAAPAKKPETKPEAKPDATRQMEIRWTGPLTIRPVGTTDKPSKKRFTVKGHGKKVVLSDAQAKLTCKEFSFENPMQIATFRDKTATPVTLELARGERVECKTEMQFSRFAGQAKLLGPGTITRFGPAASPGAPRPVSEQIVWEDRVDATFAELKSTGRDGKTQSKPYIRSATFHKNVKLTQIPTAREDKKPAAKNATPAKAVVAKAVASTQAADFVRCQTLQVDFGLTDTQRSYPQRAIASGGVTAKQQGSEFTAETATVTFRSLPDAPAKTDAKTTEKTVAAAPASPDKAKSAADAKKSNPLAKMSMGDSARVEPTRVEASGKVKLNYRDVDSPDEPPLHLLADSVDVTMNHRADPAAKPARLAVIRGKPAKLWQGENRIEGPVIHFNEHNEEARVLGGGVLTFNTKQDLSGNKLKNSRAVKVTWTKSMNFHGLGGYGTFAGDVDLQSGNEFMKCETMELRFVKAPPRKTKKTTPKETRFGMSVDGFQGRKMSRIEAKAAETKPGASKKNLVLLQSTTPTPEDATLLMRRMQLRGEHVVYDALTGQADVIGAGTFLSEDYRKPEPKKPAAATTNPVASPGGLPRPSQTMFAWKKSMRLDQKKRHIRLQERVNMVHRSGNEVLLVKGLRTVPWGRLESGRVTTMRCDKMDAWFAPPQEEKKAKPKPAETGMSLADAGPQFGPLKLFRAAGDVSLEDGPRTIDGQRLLYDASKKIINVWGYRAGETKRTNARITLRDQDDPAKPTVQTIQSPTIIYNIEKETLQTEALDATGGG